MVKERQFSQFFSLNIYKDKENLMSSITENYIQECSVAHEAEKNKEKTRIFILKTGGLTNNISPCVLLHSILRTVHT